MDVQWTYESLQLRHTINEVDDPEAYEWQDINPAELIIHAANCHIFRIAPKTQAGLNLWSCTPRSAVT